MRIGIDFDNTIAGYDSVFIGAALSAGLVPRTFVGGKTELKTYLLNTIDGETRWMRLQGRVYGALMGEAVVIAGVDDFLRKTKMIGAETFIVSHKTINGHFDEAKINLRDAAFHWLESQRFFFEETYGLRRANVYFEDTRAEKVDRISALDLDVFIDDLEEVFREPNFPRKTRRILFASGRQKAEDIECCPNWAAITSAVLHGY